MGLGLWEDSGTYPAKINPSTHPANLPLNNNLDVGHPHSGTMSSWFLVKLEFGNVGFWGEGETGAKERTNNKLNPHMASIPALTTAPPLIPPSCLQPCDKAAMLDVKKKKNLSRRIYMKIEFGSQRREMLLFLTTYMAAVTSRANQQLLLFTLWVVSC